MRYEDFYRQMESRERKSRRRNQLVASKVLSKYLEKETRNPFLTSTGDSMDDLLWEYFSVKGTAVESFFNQLLNDYHFQWSMSIHNAIYHLLVTEREREGTVDPLFWPGVQGVEQSNLKYILDTSLGIVEVYQASSVFSTTSSFHLFHRDLMGKCYDRTYEFLRENRDYKAVLSYMPNFFTGGHYHAYLEKDDQTLDIASNALYTSRKSSDKILCGEILAKLSYKQVEQKFKTIKNLVPNIPSKQKLLTLSLYYDRKNH